LTSDCNIFCGVEEYPEFVEKTRAMSRFYSQRNRDKLKSQIEKLQDWKAELEREQDELLETRKKYKRRLADTEAENEVLRLKLIEQKEQDVRLLEQRNLVHRQQLREELLMSDGRSLMGQGVRSGYVGSDRLLRGAGIGLGGGVGILHQAGFPPIYTDMNPPMRSTPQQFLGAHAHSFPSVARSLPQACPPNLLRPFPSNMLGTSLPNETPMSSHLQRQAYNPVLCGDTSTMAALRQQRLRSRGLSLDRSTCDEGGQHSTSRSP
jgi:hypothetical protein